MWSRLANEMILMGAEEEADLFVKRYIAATKDRELTKILPVYQAFQAMRSGLAYSEWIVESPERKPELSAKAHSYFNLAVQQAREISRV